jgi:hypothetical protein
MVAAPVLANSLGNILTWASGSNHAAIEIIDGTYRIITSKEGAKACKFYRQRGKVTAEEIAQNAAFAPLTGLLQK